MSQGYSTGRGRVFGPWSRYLVFEFVGRDGVAVWMVTDTDRPDEITSEPGIIRQGATEAEAVAGLPETAPETCDRWSSGEDRCILPWDHRGICRDSAGNSTATLAATILGR